MSINRNNYEVWFLDYFEGSLSQDKVAELMAFLELHYDLKEEFDNFENVSLPPAKKIVFDAKESLKKNPVISVGAINELNYAEFFIDVIENNLTDEQLKDLNAFIEKNPSLKKEFDLFSKTKVSPDPAIIFEGKNLLKKTAIISFVSINEENYAEHFIAATEGDATLSQLSELKEFLAINPQLNKEYDLFKASFLTPDASIVFDRKDELKQAVSSKKIFKLSKLYYPVSIAASIILLLTVYLLIPKGGIQTINTASRGDFETKRKIWENPDVPATMNNTSNIQTLAATTPEKKNHTFKNESEYKDFEYATAITVKTISFTEGLEKEELTKITVYEDFYAMMTKKRKLAEEQKPVEDNSKTLSLKEFALFKIKKSIAPKDKKDKVTPNDTRITMWDIADAGINKFNDITGANASINHNKDNVGYSLALGDKFEISRGNTPNK